MGFAPNVFLFGAVSAVIHYNCFSLFLAVIVNRMIGIHMISYFDDYGAYSPETVSGEELITFELPPNSMGIKMEGPKYKVGKSVEFLGLMGDCAQVEPGMSLRIYLPEEKINKWVNIAGELVESGTIQRKSLEELIGELSSPQTSIMGRFGRPAIKPLYVWVNARPYGDKLDPPTSFTLDVLSWWVASLRAPLPRAVPPRSSVPDILIYTDAATSTRIASANVIPAESYKSSGAFDQ